MERLRHGCMMNQFQNLILKHQVSIGQDSHTVLMGQGIYCPF